MARRRDQCSCPRCALPLHRDGDCRFCEISGDPVFRQFAAAEARLLSGSTNPADAWVIADYTAAVTRAEKLAGQSTTGCSRCGKPLWSGRHGVGGTHAYQRPSQKLAARRSWAHVHSRTGRLHLVVADLYHQMAAARPGRS